MWNQPSDLPEIHHDKGIDYQFTWHEEVTEAIIPFHDCCFGVLCRLELQVGEIWSWALVNFGAIFEDERCLVYPFVLNEPSGTLRKATGNENHRLHICSVSSGKSIKYSTPLSNMQPKQYCFYTTKQLWWKSLNALVIPCHTNIEPPPWCLIHSGFRMRWENNSTHTHKGAHKVVTCKFQAPVM